MLFFAHLAELLSLLYALLFVDSKNYGGRIGLLILGLIIFSITVISIYYFRNPTIFIGVIIIRAADRLIWLGIHPLKVETYQTIYRSLGVGYAEAMGKLAGGLIPFAMFPMFYYEPFLPFLLFFLLGILTIIFAWIHPIEMTSKGIDLRDEIYEF